MTVLWHGENPIGICVFTAPSLSLAGRTHFFGLSGARTRVRMQALNAQLALLSRVVLHPTYRGAGIAVPFVRASCQSCPWPWIETLAEMGHLNPFFERAGFVRVGVFGRKGTSREAHSAIYGGSRGNQRLLSQDSHEKSRYARPIYYVFDNRNREEPRSEANPHQVHTGKSHSAPSDRFSDD